MAELFELIQVPSTAALVEVFMKFQGDQLNMAVFFWYLVKGDLPSLRNCTRVQWTSHFLQGSLFQIMLVCDRHNLYDAIIYIHNTAILDYISPAERMLAGLSTSE